MTRPLTRRRRMWCGPVLLVLVAGCAQQAPPAGADDLADAADGWGVPADVVLTTAVSGFHPAAGGAGPYGADGFSVILADPESGSRIMVASSVGSISAETCADLPVTTTTGSTAEGPVECTAEDDLYYRTADDAAEYAVQRDAVLVQVTGDMVDQDVLREAVEHVRVPSADDLVAMEPPVPMPAESSGPAEPSGPTESSGPAESSGPTERGDLPPGDGAPDNSVGAGG